MSFLKYMPKFAKTKKQPSLNVIENPDLDKKLIVLQYINKGNLDDLKQLNIMQMNLNYYIYYPHIQIDTEITPLIAACYYGDNDIVKLLLQNQSIDIDMCTPVLGYTPLSIVTLKANYELMQMLLLSDAEVNKPIKTNETALSLCFLRLELQDNVFENKLLCIKMADLLLSYGGDINWIIDKEEGYSILMQICMDYINDSSKPAIDLDIIKFLLDRGADPFLKNLQNKNTLEMVQEYSNNKELISLLQKYTYNYYQQQQVFQQINSNRQLLLSKGTPTSSKNISFNFGSLEKNKKSSFMSVLSGLCNKNQYNLKDNNNDAKLNNCC